MLRREVKAIFPSITLSAFALLSEAVVSAGSDSPLELEAGLPESASRSRGVSSIFGVRPSRFSSIERELESSLCGGCTLANFAGGGGTLVFCSAAGGTLEWCSGTAGTLERRLGGGETLGKRSGGGGTSGGCSDGGGEEDERSAAGGKIAGCRSAGTGSSSVWIGALNDNSSVSSSAERGAAPSSESIRESIESKGASMVRSSPGGGTFDSYARTGRSASSGFVGSSSVAKDAANAPGDESGVSR